jgi:lycopene beta-cyclase
LGSLTYLVLILIWSLPLLLLQWLIGGDLLLRRWKVLLPGIFLPAVYLTVIDSVALKSATWGINPTQSLNVFIPLVQVPIEQFILYLVTSALIVQGLILWWAPTVRQRIGGIVRRLVRLARRGPDAVEAEAQD